MILNVYSPIYTNLVSAISGWIFFSLLSFDDFHLFHFPERPVLVLVFLRPAIFAVHHAAHAIIGGRASGSARTTAHDDAGRQDGAAGHGVDADDAAGEIAGVWDVRAVWRHHAARPEVMVSHSGRGRGTTTTVVATTTSSSSTTTTTMTTAAAVGESRRSGDSCMKYRRVHFREKKRPLSHEVGSE